jgi:hypothetical protein
MVPISTAQSMHQIATPLAVRPAIGQICAKSACPWRRQRTANDRF